MDRSTKNTSGLRSGQVDKKIYDQPGSEFGSQLSKFDPEKQYKSITSLILIFLYFFIFTNILINLEEKSSACLSSEDDDMNPNANIIRFQRR